MYTGVVYCFTTKLAQIQKLTVFNSDIGKRYTYATNRLWFKMKPGTESSTDTYLYPAQHLW